MAESESEAREPRIAAVLPRCTATLILCRRQWWDRGSKVESLGDGPGLAKGSAPQNPALPRSPQPQVRSGGWTPSGRTLPSSSSLPHPPLPLLPWQRGWRRTEPRYPGRWRPIPTPFHPSREQQRPHLGACRQNDRGLWAQGGWGFSPRLVIA